MCEMHMWIGVRYPPTLPWGVECPSRRLLGAAHTSHVWPGPYISKQVAALARCGAGSKHNRGAVAIFLDRPGDYVMLKQQIYNTLDAPARPHVLQVVKIKASGVALLEQSDAARIEEQQNIIAQCPLPIVDNNMYPERFY